MIEHDVLEVGRELRRVRRTQRLLASAATRAAVAQEWHVASYRRVSAVSLIALLTACSSTTSVDRAATTPSPSPGAGADAFPVSAFARISAGPVSKERAEEFQVALSNTSIRVGGAVAAVVMSADGTWGGTAGKADGVRALRLEDQFNIGSISKSLTAAQVMQLVEAGEIDLDDPAAEHLPADLGFDTEGATVRQLLSMRSGIPEYFTNDFMQELVADPLRVWTTEEALKSVPPARGSVGDFDYSGTNYLLLGLVIEHVRGRPLIEVLRDGVLDVPGTERLISQPQERPTPPMAMPFGESTAALQEGGGYLPSTASVTSSGTGAVFASDAPSLARWWRAFCAGEIVSQESLDEMADFQGEYGLGLTDFTAPYATSIGHPGADIGYISWAGCLPESGTVIVTLSNSGVKDKGLPQPLVVAAGSG